MSRKPEQFTIDDVNKNKWIEALCEVAGERWDNQIKKLQDEGYFIKNESVEFPTWEDATFEDLED